MSALAAVILPTGIHAAGGWLRLATLAPMTGRDEVLLVEDDGRPLAQRVTALLAGCLRTLGDRDVVSEEEVRGLRVGDREALLLHLMRLTVGEKLERVVRCPAAGCGEPIEFTLTIGELMRTTPAPAPIYMHRFDDGGGPVPTRFRLPTGADQEEAALVLGAGSGVEAAERLLRRCLHEPDARVESLMPLLRRELPPLMAELDPQAELWLDLACPACGAGFATCFDAASQLAVELSGVRHDIFRQVHTLASAYHWAEAEILEMPWARRQRYLQLLDETAERG